MRVYEITFTDAYDRDNALPPQKARVRAEDADTALDKWLYTALEDERWVSVTRAVDHRGKAIAA